MDNIQPMEYYTAWKRKGILSHAVTRMNLNDITLSEISQSPTQKDKYHTMPLIWGA